MRLSAKLLENVANINNWDTVSQAHITEGEASSLYFQLFNESKGIRYITQASAYSVSATFPSLDGDTTVVAQQPFADDKSIWKLPILSSHTPASGNFIITITEDGVSRRFSVMLGLIVESIDSFGGC